MQFLSRRFIFAELNGTLDFVKGKEYLIVEVGLRMRNEERKGNRECRERIRNEERKRSNKKGAWIVSGHG